MISFSSISIAMIVLGFLIVSLSAWTKMPILGTKLLLFVKGLKLIAILLETNSALKEKCPFFYRIYNYNFKKIPGY